MERRKIVAGNWKMNMTPSQAVKLVEELKPLVASDEVEVVYCVPAIDIVPVVEAVKGTNVAVGAENMYYEENGAYTGEISPEMLVDAGVKYVIIGHSERRDYFKECDCMLNKKVKKAFEHNLVPILCCGESLEQREMGVTIDWIRYQIKSDLKDITAEQVASMVIAYGADLGDRNRKDCYDRAGAGGMQGNPCMYRGGLRNRYGREGSYPVRRFCQCRKCRRVVCTAGY